MNRNFVSKAKKIRDVGKTSVHFKVEDEVANKFTSLMKDSGTTKQKFLSAYVKAYVESKEPQRSLDL